MANNNTVVETNEIKEIKTGSSKLSLKVKNRIFQTVVLIWFSLFALVIIYPILWLGLSGLKSNADFFLNTWSLPEKWLWENYRAAWDAGIGQFFLNSVFITVVSVVMVLLLGSMAAFGLSRFQFKGQNILLVIILSGLMLAPQVSLIPLYKLLQAIGLYNTYWALILPYVAFQLPFSIFLMRSYFLSIPKELEESAIIDGCNSWKVYRHIIVPMGKPIIASCALLTGMNVWNEFMFALVFVEDSALRTIPVGLMNLRSQLNTNFGIQLAGLAISALPMIIAYIVFQKQFVRGLSAGSVKG
ncbi:carbohydrate ABC transporter membrane protein 2 (CUT1 family) [Cytobacillus oceanisediminis]|jgi:raffinose/stachyose/melibiose transport system permease protein|uniref:Carbohydrate ABC transporter membrane protein 2 (CUT1 family) n=1 Tax=Cytobacillus oceanisediminis TaxID=665099 RepID=A0A2V2ZE54_9BACI|nr:carbohydrate ABC transporter permease [Cytobacillus oceanisediminis]PWW17637.1 carbohydrate ABC transporter membrane protein 2 (CUT1 family) [Cytobacillus oceanisediminis]